MADDPRVEKYVKQLAAIPKEFRDVATWAYVDLKPRIENFCRAHGMEPVRAQQTAMRVARLCVSQIYQDVMIARKVPKVSG